MGGLGLVTLEWKNEGILDNTEVTRNGKAGGDGRGEWRDRDEKIYHFRKIARKGGRVTRFNVY